MLPLCQTNAWVIAEPSLFFRFVSKIPTTHPRRLMSTASLCARRACRDRLTSRSATETRAASPTRDLAALVDDRGACQRAETPDLAVLPEECRRRIGVVRRAAWLGRTDNLAALIDVARIAVRTAEGAQKPPPPVRPHPRLRFEIRADVVAHVIGSGDLAAIVDRCRLPDVRTACAQVAHAAIPPEKRVMKRLAPLLSPGTRVRFPDDDAVFIDVDGDAAPGWRPERPKIPHRPRAPEERVLDGIAPQVLAPRLCVADDLALLVMARALLAGPPRVPRSRSIPPLQRKP